MYSLGQQPGKYYILETSTLYGSIAKEAGMKYELVYYKENGAAQYRFMMDCIPV